MTGEDLLLIKDLKARVAEFMALYESLELKNSKLNEEILGLKKQIYSLEEEKVKLGQKYENLRMAKYYESGFEDNQIAKQKVNKLLREIDKCIALLNK
jgi:hypothetical protein